MKKTFLMLLAGIVLAGFTFTACSDDDDDPVVVTPDEGGSTDEGGGSTDTPDEPDEPDTPEVTLHESLQGSDYYVLVMDDYSFEEISDKVTLDLRAGWQDEDNPEIYHGCELWIWEGTYTGGTCSGLNFYGEGAEWTSLVVTSYGWSGIGYCLYLDDDQGALLNNIDDSYYLHIAYKTSQSGISHAVFICGPDGTEARGVAAIGEADYIDGDVTYPLVQPDSGTFETGEWNEYNIPVSSFGLDWSATYTYGQNLLCILSGGLEGTTLDLDAVFFYKKAE